MTTSYYNAMDNGYYGNAAYDGQNYWGQQNYHGYGGQTYAAYPTDYTGRRSSSYRRSSSFRTYADDGNGWNAGTYGSGPRRASTSYIGEAYSPVSQTYHGANYDWSNYDDMNDSYTNYPSDGYKYADDYKYADGRDYAWTSQSPYAPIRPQSTGAANYAWANQSSYAPTENQNRKFVQVDGNMREVGHTYHNKNPGQAALKAASRGYRDINLYDPAKGTVYAYEGGTRPIQNHTPFTLATGKTQQPYAYSRGSYNL